MKIGFVYESSFATKNGSNHLLGSIIEAMLKEGHEIYLFQSSYSNDLESEYPKSFNSKAFHYCPIKVKSVSKTNFIKRYLNGLSFAKKCGKEFKKHNLDLFFIQSAPTVSFVISEAKKKGKPIVYNIHDVFPGSAYELGILRTKLFDWLLKRIQMVGYKKANKIIVVSNDMKDILIKQRVEISKIEVVHTWFDSDSIHLISNEQNTFVKENNIDLNKLILQYAGNVGQVFGLDEFSKIVKSLKDNNRVEFHVIGSGVKLEELKKETTGCNIRFFDWQPQERMSEVFSYPNIEIIPLHHGVIGNNVPTKMALAMACGKPVLNIVEESEYYRDFNSNNIGWAFKQNDIYKVSDLLNKISIDRRLLNGFSDSCVEYNNKAYSKTDNIEKVMKIIDDLHM